ncbi:uncharacterized protein YggE [Virgibacillus natechei]|uniref:Uncharacterized protein YggE n=1 Tax=Virgibacillus natechei TaxID=1216297 RepID=A0ABS4IIZ8_9BACI|nr:SIMPL domain-containing protein [Virgibacillus natechei]MBP1970550.1 uncharacterized protein YggE [Virgibacillus natechei]UZD14050.1 SIMPL domain-containing protein [Virgibacillus natechei]
MYYHYVPQFRQPLPSVESQTKVMTVTGTGSVTVRPDIVTVQLEVRTENTLLQQAQQENANTMNQVIQALMDAGIARESIQTTAYTINPRYDYMEGEQVFRGYEVKNEITVRIRNTNHAGSIIDVAVQSGVNRVADIRFTVENEQHYYEQALNASLQQASSKAKTIAETMQLPLDPIPITIVEQLSEPPRTYQTMLATDESMTTPIEPGQMIIRASVEVKFQY